jgi:hypothetical protein
MAIEPAFLIVLDRANPDELNSVQEVVKNNARGWWHRYTNVWFAGGGTSATYWRDLISPVLESGPSSVLVLRLPKRGARSWAYYGPEGEERLKWLRANYFGGQ